MAHNISFDVLTSFFNHVKKAPKNLAIAESNRKINYEDFAELATRMAKQFKHRSVQPKVAILLPQSIEAYASMFGTLIAGGIYCPINTSSPPDRQNMIIDQFAPDLIIGEAECLRKYENDYFTINLAQIKKNPLTEPEPKNELAYVIFTSGSTGVPKGVMITRDALNHYVLTMTKEMAIRSDDRLSQHPNVGFDLSVLDVFGALCSGASLHPVKDPLDRLNLSKFVAKNKLTIWNSVPSVVNVMFRSKKLCQEDLKSLRLFTFCGEPLLKEHLDLLFEHCPNATVHNTYGPTEATVSCTLLRLDQTSYHFACGKHSISIGDPISKMNIHLIDNGISSDQGEIVITGPQLAKGYWKDNKKTSSSFKIINVNGVSKRAYFTGDFGYRQDHQIFFSSRKDAQIKINGYRVELGEVDQAVRRAGGEICQSIFYDKKIYTFVEGEHDSLANTIKQHLMLFLPRYAIPQSIIFLKKIPVTANDKIDTQKLHELIQKFVYEEQSL